MNNMVIWAI